MLSASRFPPLINDSPSFSKDVSGIVIILGEVESRVLSFVKWTFSTHHSVILSPAPLVILLEHYNFSLLIIPKFAFDAWSNTVEVQGEPQLLFPSVS